MTTNPEPHSICIFRLSAIGDVTHVIPVVKTLQNRFPEARITWVIGRLEHRLLSGLPGVEFIVFDKSAGWQGVRELQHQLWGRQFDVLLQMQLSLRANLLSRLVKAKRRIGFDKKRAKELHGLVINERIPYLPDCHVLDGLMQFATHLGCEQKIMNWDMPIAADDVKFAKKNIKTGQPNVIISPCSSHQLRNWSVEKYAAIADALAADYAAHVILVGSPAPKEKAFIAEIESRCRQTVSNMAGQDTLKQLWCLLKQADLVISPDSGPLHMSGCVNTPVIGLLAASNYKRSGSYQFPELTVDKYSQAIEMFLQKPVAAVKWGAKAEFAGAMDLITVDEVLNNVNTVLNPVN